MTVLPDPKTLILQAGGFVIVLLILWKFLFKAAADVFAARQRDVEAYYSSAEQDRMSAEELKSEYEQHLANVHEETRTKIAEAVKDGQRMREEILAEARSRSEQVLDKAQDEIRRERDKAIVELKATVATLAVEAASKLIDEQLDAQKHRDLIGKVIDGLTEAPK